MDTLAKKTLLAVAAFAAEQSGRELKKFEATKRPEHSERADAFAKVAEDLIQRADNSELRAQGQRVELQDNTLNLDCETPDFLKAFARVVSTATEGKARELFPSCPTGYVQTTRKLGRYAKWKRAAMLSRLKGNITQALKHEETCEKIYRSLPPYARW